MAKTLAFVRKPGPRFSQALSTHPEKNSINLERACSQHGQYVSALKSIGMEVVVLPALDACPDVPFVEDTAVVFDHVAIACNSGEASRRDEGAGVHAELKKYRKLETLPESVLLEGGDVMNTEDKLFVGISRRTNRQAVAALAEFAGKPVVPVAVRRGLHLKSAATYLGNNILVLDPASVDTAALTGFKWIETGESDRYAANCLAIGNTVLMAGGFPRVTDKIRQEGFTTVELELSEFAKADGGPTCLSLIFKTAVE